MHNTNHCEIRRKLKRRKHLFRAVHMYNNHISDVDSKEICYILKVKCTHVSKVNSLKMSCFKESFTSIKSRQCIIWSSCILTWVAVCPWEGRVGGWGTILDTACWLIISRQRGHRATLWLLKNNHNNMSLYILEKGQSLNFDEYMQRDMYSFYTRSMAQCKAMVSAYSLQIHVPQSCITPLIYS